MDPATATPDGPLEPAPYGPLPVGSGRQVWARRPADEAEAKALASPLRLRILRVALHEPRTNKEIAEALGRNPASVLHHVRTLVDTGFLVEQPRRRGQRGSRELPYLASGKSFYVSKGMTEVRGRTCCSGRSSRRSGAGARAARQHPARLPAQRRGPGAGDGPVPGAVDEIAAMPSDPEGEPWSIYLGTHPEA